MWCLNWFCPAYWRRKRSSSGEPDWKRDRSSPSRSGLISIAHQFAEGFRRLTGSHLLQDRCSGSPRHDQLGMDDDVRRQLLQCLQVVPESLLDEMAFLHAGGADVPLKQV